MSYISDKLWCSKYSFYFPQVENKKNNTSLNVKDLLPTVHTESQYSVCSLINITFLHLCSSVQYNCTISSAVQTTSPPSHLHNLNIFTFSSHLAQNLPLPIRGHHLCISDITVFHFYSPDIITSQKPLLHVTSSLSCLSLFYHLSNDESKKKKAKRK